MEGWAQHVMMEILKVSEASRKWLDWPIQFLDQGLQPEPHALSLSRIISSIMMMQDFWSQAMTTNAYLP